MSQQDEIIMKAFLQFGNFIAVVLISPFDYAVEELTKSSTFYKEKLLMASAKTTE